MTVATAMPYIVEIDGGMSNFDHAIDEGLEELLRSEEVFTRYAGWEFNGLVWYDRDADDFACEVWRYHLPREVIHADTLEELMSAVSDKWGED